MSIIRLAEGLTLPADAVTQTFLIVGKRGSGKSNTAARFVEQLHAARLPFVVLDPVDTWWGLKAASDGGRGLGVYVFGGSHADLPLEPGGGALIAEVLCEHRIPMVLSVKHLSGRERSGFMVAFAQTLFQKWTGGPLHVVLEEAHELAPQNTQNAKEGEQQMLGAFKRLWKLGRASGIGGTAVTQRPASLSKDITTQSEILIAHRTIGPQDVEAVGAWVKYHGEGTSILGELPTLPTGEAFVWAPEFPEGKPLGLRRVSIARRETFDSASTPKVGERRVEPKALAAVDLESLRDRMAAMIERAKADDPRELRKRIADLERQIAAKPAATVERVEVPILSPEQIAQLRWAADRLDEAAKEAAGIATDVRADLSRFTAIDPRPLPREVPPQPVQRRVEAPCAPASAAPPRRSGAKSAEQRILDSAAWWMAAGISAPTRHQVAFVAGYTVNGHFNNIVGGLRTKGLVDYPTGGGVELTTAGVAAANAADDVPTRAALIEKVIAVLDPAPGRIFQAVADAGADVTREQLATKTGYTVNGHFNNMVGSLRSLGLIEYPRGGGVRLGEMFDALT